MCFDCCKLCAARLWYPLLVGKILTNVKLFSASFDGVQGCLCLLQQLLSPLLCRQLRLWRRRLQQLLLLWLQLWLQLRQWLLLLRLLWLLRLLRLLRRRRRRRPRRRLRRLMPLLKDS